jgi:hypothetical protein
VYHAVNTNGSKRVNTNSSNVVASPGNSSATLHNLDGSTFVIGGASLRPTGP